MAKNSQEEKYREVMGKLMAILRDHKSAVDSYVNETKLHKSQHKLLMSLSHMGNHVSQRDLAEKLNITPAAVAVTLKKLEKNGFVEKKIQESDNRYNEVVMTEKGRRIVKESHKLFQSIDAKLFEGFTEEEMDQLNAYLERIIQNAQRIRE